MKIALCFTHTLFAFVLFAFVASSFAQDAAPEYVVRVIYFIPNDHQPQPDIDNVLDTRIKKAQHYFADQLEAHGFARKTFRIETDDVGNAIVHHVNGQHDDAYYQDPSFGSRSAVNEIREQFDMSKNIYYITLDSSSPFLDGSEVKDTSGETISGVTGWARGTDINGVAVVTNFAVNPTIHELGHTFGLEHDYRSNLNANRIYTDPNFRELMTTTFCAAEWLDAHRYFNLLQDMVNNNTDIQLHPPKLIEPPTNIRLRVTLFDPDGLRQVQLLHPQFHPRWRWGETDVSTFAACQRISGTQATIDFVTRDLIGVDATSEIFIARRIFLEVMDVHGNITSRGFDIDIEPLLSFTKTVSLPDKNLEASIREELGLSSRNPITYMDMYRVSKLVAVDREITDLTGLEHAIHIRELNLLYNKVSDITPLSKLTHLRDLYITSNQVRDITPLKDLDIYRLGIGENPISDITVTLSLKNLGSLSLSSNPIRDISPLWELTQLQNLSIRFMKIDDISPLAKFTKLTLLQLDDNGISDITPLSKLTHLERLTIWRNPVTDVSPLAELANLTRLHLEGLPIKNRKPLLTLLRKNPDIKIYLKFGGEPLPVTLSNFRAAHNGYGVILNWTTESEVDNAGFYIYRSETKDGEFKVVTPTMIQGAGTTGERNEYTWTDTTAKPNTVYYYQIEDVSHAGKRKRLATVRLRGLVSARGKLTTTWARVKNH